MNSDTSIRESLSENLNENLSEKFTTEKFVIAALTLRGRSLQEKLDRWLREVTCCMENGCAAVLLEGRAAESEELCQAMCLPQLQRYPLGKRYPLGVRICGDLSFSAGWELAVKCDADFILADSVAGHLRRADEEDFEKQVALCRAKQRPRIIGGVRFRDQPILSGRPLLEDLVLGMKRCDAIAVSGNGAERDLPIEKLKKYRAAAKDFPLIVDGGVKPDNIAFLADADGIIVRNAIKNTGKESGEADADRIKTVLEEIRKLPHRPLPVPGA